MAFYITVIGLLILAVAARRAITEETKSVGEGWAAAATVVIVGGLAAMLILGGIGASTVERADHKLL